MKDKIYVTKEGLEAFKTEYKELTEIKRPKISERIKSAREMGDISENAEYEAAREEQAFVEGRIRELAEILKNVETISNSSNKSEVSLGSKVKLHIDGGEEVFDIVGAPEANPVQNKISHESPLGKALIGKKVGEKVQVDAPMGTLTYTVLSIS